MRPHDGIAPDQAAALLRQPWPETLVLEDRRPFPGILPDDYSFANPSNEKLVVDQIKADYAAKERGQIVPLDYDYEFFASDAKSEFSMAFSEEMARIILLKDADVAAEWENFLTINKAIWEPVIRDLNNEFFK